MFECDGDACGPLRKARASSAPHGGGGRVRFRGDRRTLPGAGRGTGAPWQARSWLGTHAFTPSPVQGREHGFGMGLGDAEQSAGASFGAAVALFPVLKGAGTDADERGEFGTWHEWEEFEPPSRQERQGKRGIGFQFKSFPLGGVAVQTSATFTTSPKLNSAERGSNASAGSQCCRSV